MSSSQKPKAILWVIAIIIAMISAIAWGYLPHLDDPAYFNFADKRFVFGVPNFFDVFSNLLFIYLSLFALWIAFANRHAYQKRLWEPFILFNLAVFFTGWGSSLFHISASPKMIFWDRLPMAFGFSALLSLILSDRVIIYFHRWCLLVLLGLTIAVMYYGEFVANDIRPYLILQFGSLLTVILLLLLFRKGHMKTSWLWIALGFYVIAKIFELNDHEIFVVTDGYVSGHTLKHIMAAMGVLILDIAFLGHSQSR